MQVFDEIFERLAKVEKALARIIRTGVVKKIDGDFAEISVGEGDPIRARKKSFAAGGVKMSITASVGEAVTLFCPNGDARQAFYLPGDWTGNNENPSSGEDEALLTVGSASLLVRDGQVLIKAGEKEINLTDGGITTKGNLDVNKGYIRNDGVPVDKTHKHKYTMHGPTPSHVPVGG